MQKFQVVAWTGSGYARARVRSQEPGDSVLLVLVQLGVLVIMIQLRIVCISTCNTVDYRIMKSISVC